MTPVLLKIKLKSKDGNDVMDKKTIDYVVGRARLRNSIC